MSTGIARAIANRLCGALRVLSPDRVRTWADALWSEVAHIPEDREALRFAMRSFCGLLPRVLLARLLWTANAGADRLSGDPAAMGRSFDPSCQPRLTGAVSSIAAVLLGVAYMKAAGAPVAYLVLNLAALAVGLAALAIAVRLPPETAGRFSGTGVFAMATALLTTSLFGSSVEGATRWFVLGPLFMQTSLLFVPAILLGFARNASGLATVGIVVAALALALQPDRAMAGVLAAGLATLALFRFDRYVGAALASAGFAFVITLTKSAGLSALAYVDKVLFTAFDTNLFAGAAVWAGAALLLAPAIAGWRGNPDERKLAVTFGSVWFAIVLAAALGNYPTPLVGYGGSAIIGYLLSVAALPRSLTRRLPTGAEPEKNRSGAARDRLFRRRALPLAGLLAFGVTGAAGEQPASDCARPEVEKVEIPNTVWQPGPRGEQAPLWPDDVDLQLPDYQGNAEMIGNGSPLIAGRTWNWATYISRPTMTIFAPKGDNTGAAMLVLPGGGYAAVAMDLEGTEICDWITGHGVTCIVLKYRAPQLWRREENGVRLPPERLYALEDAQRAMSLLRDRADAYGIDPDKIGVIGFSAGAHLATALSNAEGRAYERVDAADKISPRPDFAIVMYLGRSLAKRNPDTDLSLGPWVNINADAPPTLLIHAMNDPANDVRHSIAYGLALHEAGVPVDMRFFAKGCHAFGLRPTSDPITTEWPTHAIEWLRSINML